MQGTASVFMRLIGLMEGKQELVNCRLPCRLSRRNSLERRRVASWTEVGLSAVATSPKGEERRLELLIGSGCGIAIKLFNGVTLKNYFENRSKKPVRAFILN
jgi:hypothetical protein